MSAGSVDSRILISGCELGLIYWSHIVWESGRPGIKSYPCLTVLYSHETSTSPISVFGSGAPRKIDKKLGEAVEEEMARDPSQDGYQAGFWTVGLLCLKVKIKFSVKLSVNTMRRALHKLGYVCRRPRLYTGGEKKQLPQEAEKAILKAKEGRAITLFSGESSFHLLPVLHRMWMKVGK